MAILSTKNRIPIVEKELALRRLTPIQAHNWEGNGPWNPALLFTPRFWLTITHALQGPDRAVAS